MPETVWPRIVIGVATTERMPAEIFWSCVAFAQQGYAFAKLPPMDKDVIRNRYALHLLENPQFTHLLLLDVDHDHPYNLVKHLRARLREDPSRQVISSLYFRRGAPYDPVAFDQADDGRLLKKTSVPKGVNEVAALGLGCLLVAREVFETLPPPWFRYTYNAKNPFGGYRGWGEDIWFCFKCRQHGVKLWWDTTIESTHLSQAYITQQVFERYLQDHPEEFED